MKFGEALVGIIITLCVISVLIFGGVAIYNHFSNKTIESTHRIEPIIKFTTDGSKIDTIFVYKK